MELFNSKYGPKLCRLFWATVIFVEPQSYVLRVRVFPGKLTWNPKMEV